MARYRDQGEAAFEPPPRRPKTSPNALSPGTAELIVRLRKDLAGQGLDAGPHTICWHLEHHHHRVRVSPATVSRTLARRQLVTPDPSKRPKSSYGPIVLASFRAAVAGYGPPASTLTDNGLVFTARFAGGRGGRNALEAELRRLGITQKNGKPNHPRPRAKSSGSSRP